MCFLFALFIGQSDCRLPFGNGWKTFWRRAIPSLFLDFSMGRIKSRELSFVMKSYQLIDSGQFAKLERVGEHLLVRPSPQAVWDRTLSEKEWKKADAVYVRSSSGGGHWDFHQQVSEEIQVEFGGRRFLIKPTGFGHLGLFPEQSIQWSWISDNSREEMSILNLFGYTGGSTFAASFGGSKVCHCDASKGVVDWARKNAELNGLFERPIRWIVDDARKFIAREIKRGSKYEGIILDPPSFGRGAKGEVFKIDEDLPPLLTDCEKLLSDQAGYVLLSTHTPGYTPLVLKNLLDVYLVSKRGGRTECGEMTVPAENGPVLPSGAFARWTSSGE